MSKRKVQVSSSHIGEDDLRKRLQSGRVTPQSRTGSRTVQFLSSADKRESLENELRRSAVNSRKATASWSTRVDSSSPNSKRYVTGSTALISDPPRKTFRRSVSTYDHNTTQPHKKYCYEKKVVPNASNTSAVSSADLSRSSSKSTAPNSGQKRPREQEYNMTQNTGSKRFKTSHRVYHSLTPQQSSSSSTSNCEERRYGQHQSFPVSEKKAVPHNAKNPTTSSLKRPRLSSSKPCDNTSQMPGPDRPREEEMPKPMSYTCVKMLCEKDRPEETAAELNQDNMFRRFEALLSTGKHIRYDLMKLVVSLIETICRSRMDIFSNKVFGLIQKTNFWDSLSKFIGELYSTKETFNDPNLPSLITNLCMVFNLSLERFPDLYLTIPIPQLKDAVGLFKDEGKLKNSKIDRLLEDLNTKRQQIMKEKRDKAASQLQPPDDFRKLSVFPTREDIFRKGRPFLRENLVGSPFSNVDHYLDVQFRLLKEDSLADLRSGIRNLRRQDQLNEYSNDTQKSDLQKNDIKVYYRVRINELVLSKNRANGLVFNVSFDSSHRSIKHTNWARSKRLLFGSLVCLLSDDFEGIYFATVQNRTPDMLKEGYVQLCFEGDIPTFGQHTQGSYRMVESSSAYFMAYRHILKQLQEIKEETMPFKDYIIACKRETKKPAYLQQKDVDGNPKTIDFSPIVEQSDVVNDDEKENLEALKKVDPGDLSTWPDAKVIGLNDSQYRAFQSAIRKEFAVIQGPPGTGKTYLGLKIAHVLLANRHLWKDHTGETNPILMLAFTNHALDQFLEGLSVDKHDVIRAGGRSSCETLRNCNLNVVRRERRQGAQYDLGTNVSRRFREVERDLKDCETRLHRCTSVLSQSFKGILPAREFTMLGQGHEDELYNDEDMLEFLSINRSSTSQRKDTLQTEQIEEFTENEELDNEGHFSASRFTSFKEDDESASACGQIVVCFTKETKNPQEIWRNLNYIGDSEDHHARRLEETIDARRLWRLNKRDRWCLYRLWLARLREHLGKNIRELQRRHLELKDEREELRNIEDLNILRRAHVVGMTTTWASMNHKLLKQLRPRVVIVEEAAEVFEGHVVSSLTQYCQHLILIGDHRQLRPNPSVYNLGMKYRLDVSLFERMIEADVAFDRLAVQHRMRPEFSQIVRHIYSDLQDHSSVTEYENVKGISKNLFFVDHSFREELCNNIHSKSNVHEASFLIALCRYLLRQGYDSSQITILTTYTGQMFEIRDQIKSCDWFSFGSHRPRVATVDNFQGEENDIILLSLVRNNEEENIGFLKADNRVCVALSRARKGFYIVGNRTILAKQSPLWKAVLDDFQKNGCIGKYLPLVCSNHAKENLVSCDKDFEEKVPNGGCLQPCEYRLECGHACSLTCHPNDHENLRCKKPCERKVIGCQIEGHKCTKICWEPCDTFCEFPVKKTLKCGHFRTLACSDDEKTAKCEERCTKTLSCGHRCQNKCSQPCTKKCFELVKKTDWPCGHENTIACSATPKDCPVPCNSLLECGHRCPGKCGMCIQGRVHMKCKQKCERRLICSHECKEACTKNCPPCQKQCCRKCTHSKCSHVCGEMCVPCKERCDWECDHFKCNKLCSEMCDRPRCNKPCKRKLTCGRKGRKPHYCRGLCGERCVCVICNNNNGEAITEIFFGTEDEENALFIRLKDCDHIFEYTALDRYMDLNDSSEGIKTKDCPRCKQPIQKTWRYGDVVKKIHQDIDNVKRKVLGDTTDLEDRKQLVKELIQEVIPMMKIHKCSQNTSLITNSTLEAKLSKVHYQDVLLLESRVRLMKNWLLVKKRYKDTLNSCVGSAQSIDHGEFEEEMDNVWGRIMVQPSHINTRILEDLRLELERMSLKRDVLVLQSKVNSIGLCLKQPEEELIKEVRNSLRDKARIKEEIIGKFKRQILDIYSEHPKLSPITQEEKVQIVKAIGLKQGHWFKCPQGHVYAIGECGGAMERGRCPECDAVIGGQQHCLVDDNQLAPEMDGAQHAAWSEQANLLNYQIE